MSLLSDAILRSWFLYRLVLVLLITSTAYSQTITPPFPLPNLKQASVNTSCNTWTFQKKYGTIGRSELPAGAFTLPTGSQVVFGSDSSVVSGVMGKIVKLDVQGNVLVSRNLSFPSHKVYIRQLRCFSNGLLYGIAEVKNNITSVSTPAIFTMDTASFGLQGGFALTVGGLAGSWQAVDLREAREASYTVLVQNDSLFNLSRFALSGSLVWSQTRKGRSGLKAIGLTNDYWDVYVAYNETDSGYRKGVVTDFNFTNGLQRFSTSIGGGADSTNYYFHSMQHFNLRPRITGMQVKNNQAAFVRINFGPTTLVEFKEVFTQPFPVDSNFVSLQNEWVEVLATASPQAPQSIFLTNTFFDNYNAPITGHQIDYSYPVQLVALTRSNDGGSVIIGKTTGNLSQMVVSKVDSVGMLPGCSSTTIPASFTYVRPPWRTDSASTRAYILQPVSLSLMLQTTTVQATEECKSLYCPTVPEPDTCLRTFFKEYRDYTGSGGNSELVKTTAKNLMARGGASLGIVTPLNDYPLGARLSLYDTLGHVLRSSLLLGTQRIYLTRLIALRDGNFLVAGMFGNQYDSTDLFLLKFDEQLNILWQKQWHTMPYAHSIGDVFESAEGDIFCYVLDGVYTFNRGSRYVFKLTAAGVPLWFKRYDAGPSAFGGFTTENSPRFTELNDHVYLKFTEESSDQSPYLMKLRKTDGVLAWIKKYQLPLQSNWYNYFTFRSLVADANSLYMMGTVSGPRTLLLKIAQDGSVAKANYINSDLYLASLSVKAGNKLIGSVQKSTVPANVFGVQEMDTSFQPLRRQLIRMPKSGNFTSMEAFSDSVTFGTGGLYDYYKGSGCLNKYNFNSTFASCEAPDFPVSFEATVIPVLNQTTVADNLPLPPEVAVNAYFTDVAQAYSHFYCGNVPSCTSLSITGPSTICDTINTYTFAARTNAGCPGLVNWALDTVAGQLKVMTQTDSTIGVKLKKTGIFSLYGNVFGSCAWIRDTMKITATAGNTVLNLGPDKDICPGNSILLHAGNGFNSYQWQDGSTDSTYTVTKPGLYYVTVGSCGNFLKDSVTVTAAPPIIFNVSPDRVKCNGDTIQFNAPADFLNYAWSPQYNISSTTSANVVVNPSVDTTYFVKAEKMPGCFAYDTIRVSVFHSPVINLGLDVSFCSGDSLTLDAGAGFISYIWNGAIPTQTNTVRTAGTYWVVGTTTDGCKSTDTLRVPDVWALPTVSLDKNTALCLGAKRKLSAGTFSSYLWQDGSTASTYAVNGVGTYWVRVTDARNCVGGDTTSVTTILPLPSAFLPIDTTICSYGTLTLKPLQPFVSYAWSSGSTQRSITVDKPGNYWLEAVDQYGCSGRDTITVNPKQCMSGVYIPTAFTPNHDGKNDAFKAMVFGNAKKFELTVYNRWGQVIFYTTDPSNGWDGKVAGVEQRSDAFVWTCRYQLEGGQDTFVKGTVTLIR